MDWKTASISAFLFQRGQNTDSGSICREASFEGISRYVELTSMTQYNCTLLKGGLVLASMQDVCYESNSGTDLVEINMLAFVASACKLSIHANMI